ncbi:MAG: carbohydrate-binding domain-containing protein [Butyricicoccaceae bacterium]
MGGTGTLTACGNTKNGIKGASDAVITVDELTLNIEAADDGLSCDDELTIKGGTGEHHSRRRRRQGVLRTQTMPKIRTPPRSATSRFRAAR